MTAVDRQTRCIVGWALTPERSADVLQTMLDQALWAKQYFSDAFPLYQSAVYAGLHRALHDKSQTYSVEAVNADLRHYLARLARASRCFSRAFHALQSALHLFIFAYNRRQLYKHAFPNYPAHLKDFISVAS
jgi:insertion element IS1 protein InsB